MNYKNVLDYLDKGVKKFTRNIPISLFIMFVTPFFVISGIALLLMIGVFIGDKVNFNELYIDMGKSLSISEYLNSYITFLGIEVTKETL